MMKLIATHEARKYPLPNIMIPSQIVLIKQRHWVNIQSIEQYMIHGDWSVHHQASAGETCIFCDNSWDVNHRYPTMMQHSDSQLLPGSGSQVPKTSVQPSARGGALCWWGISVVPWHADVVMSNNDLILTESMLKWGMSSDCK